MWLCLQPQPDGLSSYPLRRMAAQLSRQRLPAGTISGACELLGRCFRKSLLPRRRDLSDLVLQVTIS